ncbi:hypothetical protein A7A08_01658 [Methyloligella halotolerans]|uniref:Uncharacterized protein n=1 Tax=Methyloligella halotolerans TaxID=1177755 RepID=A0A1E2RZI4_9HYPH|nr:DUF6476 family protein [Methyloligella halotolerans]ODA67624.1 hypothetical protein A7A08_01658 [Methyloligella halotolerans]
MTNRGDTPPDLDNTPIEGSPFTPRQVRMLKIAVTVMGVLLVAGFLLIIATIAFQATQMGVEDAPAQVAERPSKETPSPMPREAFDVAIPEGADVAGMDVDGDRLALHLRTAKGSEVLIVDLKTGRIVSRIALRPE